MELLRTERDGVLELSFSGRLDAYWAQHLADEVGEVLREGRHSVRLNLSRSDYISSAGIGTLVGLYKQFAAVNGSFAIVEPSRQIRQVIEMVGLAPMLTGAAAAAAAPVRAREPEAEHRQVNGTALEIYDYRVGGTLECNLVGRPERLPLAAFTAEDCHTVAASPHHLALGLGAFGASFDDCRGRFGEFLAVAGSAACQPTDGANRPDYMVASAGFVPRLSALYALSCDGNFAKLVRFESASGKGPLALSGLLENCMQTVEAETAAIAMVAETSGLMGVQLKRPPVREGAESAGLFAFPDVRAWLSFSPEQCYTRSLALIVGVISRDAAGTLAPFVRPLRNSSALHGHLHAAAFGYRPLPRGKIELDVSVRALFDAGGPVGLLHLLADERQLSAGGESELLRGACWIGPVQKISHVEELA
jgi:anti-anti-sigma factor